MISNATLFCTYQSGVIFQANICLSIFVAEAVNFGFNPSNLGCLEPSMWMTQFGLGAIQGGLSLLYNAFSSCQKAIVG